MLVVPSISLRFAWQLIILLTQQSMIKRSRLNDDRKRSRHDDAVVVRAAATFNQPTAVLIEILSYIEQDMHYDGVNSVNKQWLNASHLVPNTVVRWHDNEQSESSHDHNPLVDEWLHVYDDYHDRHDNNKQRRKYQRGVAASRVSSFTLASRKYPRLISLLNFPFHHSFDITIVPATLHTLVVNADISDKSWSNGSKPYYRYSDAHPDAPWYDPMRTMIQRIVQFKGFKAKEFQSLTFVLTHSFDIDERIVKILSRCGQLLYSLRKIARSVPSSLPSSSSSSSSKMEETQSVQLRWVYEGVEASTCRKDRNDLMNHGSTFTLRCASCDVKQWICCETDRANQPFHRCYDHKGYGFGCDRYPVSEFLG
jgi:hypothetical protein